MNALDKDNYVIILAGGVGKRLWPKSRDFLPKQFIDLFGTGRSLLQVTYSRFLSIVPKSNIYVTTHELFKSLVLEQLKELAIENILLIPEDRNTAPVIAYSCYKIMTLNPKANLIIAPSDHLILNESIFKKTLKKGINYSVNKQVLVTIGISPVRADTNFGYIECADYLENSVQRVISFKEKPSLSVAQEYIQSGKFLWNSGIFIWNCDTIQKAFAKHCPRIHDIFIKGLAFYNKDTELRFLKDNFYLCENISIDYAILEKSDNVVTIKADLGWSDLGTWESLYQASTKDEFENVIVAGKIHIMDTKNCIVHTQKTKTIYIKGLDNYIIVDENDILFIHPRGEAF